MATQTDAGLTVPVIRDAQDKNVWQLAAEIGRLAEAARANKLAPHEMGGGTITVTSLGPLGGIATTPVINRPEVAIIGPNKIVERPVFVDNGRGGDDIRRAKLMNLSISCDHRVVDGWGRRELRAEPEKVSGNPGPAVRGLRDKPARRTPGGRDRLYRAAAGEQLHQDDDDRDHEQDVDQSACDVEREEAQQPEHEQDDGDRPQHEISPPVQSPNACLAIVRMNEKTGVNVPPSQRSVRKSQPPRVFCNDPAIRRTRNRGAKPVDLAISAFIRPDTLTARLAFSAARPSRTTASGSPAKRSNRALSASPATSANSVRVGPGAERDDPDALVLHLLVQRLGEAQHERLGGAVDAEPGSGLERRGRGEIEDAARTPCDHLRQDAVRERHQRAAVEIDHAELRADLAIGERAADPEPGVVDQRIDRQPRRGDVGEQARGRRGIGEVGGEDVDGDATAQVGGQRLQPVGSSCGEG